LAGASLRRDGRAVVAVLARVVLDRDVERDVERDQRAAPVASKQWMASPWLCPRSMPAPVRARARSSSAARMRSRVAASTAREQRTSRGTRRWPADAPMEEARR
jgi:hypothetical protein